MFQKDFHAEGRRQYDHVTNLKDAQQNFTLLKERLKQYDELKPDDLNSISYSNVLVQNLSDKVDKLMNSVIEDNAKVFTSFGKLKSGQECAHRFNEKCLGNLKSLSTEILEAFQTIEDIRAKHKRMYPLRSLASGESTTRKRRQKENRAKSKKRKAQREEKNCARVLSSIVSSTCECKYGDIIADPELLNVEAISKLGKCDIKWLKVLISKNFITKEALQACDHLNPELEIDYNETESDTEDEMGDV